MQDNDHDPKHIWLEPWCNECEVASTCRSEGRLWCEDDVWGKCDECGRKPVLYKIVSDRTRRRMKNNGETK